MLDIYLTDEKKHVQFQDYPGDHPVKFILNFKKIFPSVMELLLPVLPEDNDLEKMQWESNLNDFKIFQLLVSGWGIVELRLTALAQFKDKVYADELVKRAKTQRQEYSKKQPQLKTVELDYLFLQSLHALVDGELIEIGEKFYLPTLHSLWKGYIPQKVLNANF